MSNKAILKQFFKEYIFAPKLLRLLQYFVAELPGNHLILTSNIINIHIVGMVKTFIMPMEEILQDSIKSKLY